MKMKIITIIISICQGAESFNQWIEDNASTLKKLSVVMVLQGVAYFLAEEYEFKYWLDMAQEWMWVPGVLIGSYLHVFKKAETVEVELIDEIEGEYKCVN